MRTTHIGALLVVMGLVGTVGCSGGDPGGGEEATTSASDALRKCGPEDDCPPPPKPKPAPRPAPKPTGVFTLPIATIASSFEVLFAGTTIQISQTGEMPVAITQDRVTCVVTDTAASRACHQHCMTIESSAEASACHKGCASQEATTCTAPACTVADESSYLLPSSGITGVGGTRACTASSCPACTGNADPVVKARRIDGIPAPIYAGYGASCYVKRLRWDIDATDATSSVTMDATGLRVALVGTSSKPAVLCDGGPDVDVDHPTIRLDVRPVLDLPTGTWTTYVSARFDADVHMHDPIAQPLAWVVDLQDKVTSKATAALAPQVQSLGDGFATGIGTLVKNAMPADAAKIVDYGFSPAGIVVTYATK